MWVTIIKKKSTVNIRSGRDDRHIPMSLLRQVKDALRGAHATRIIYTANDKKR